MFSYYGSKSKVVDLYPAPRYGKIIEPFAGSARYALKYFDRDILLVDKYELVVKLWKWLQQCSPQDIMGLPEPTYKQKIDELDICQEAKWLLGFITCRGVTAPRKTAQMFSDVAEDKKRIAKDLDKIRHWKIQLGDYHDVPNEQATWFIDPPYQREGDEYIHGNKEIDYAALSTWSMSRLGQIIVCENTEADWMPFTPIGQLHGAFSQTTEAIWCNDVQQLRMELADARLQPALALEPR